MTITPEWIPEVIRYGTDPLSGAEIEQLTSEPVTSTNIYCEQRYTSADGTRIAIARHPFGQPYELWVCDLVSLRLCRIGPGSIMGTNAPRNALYYATSRETDGVLMRLNMMDFTAKEICRMGDIPHGRGGAISPDERWLVGGPIPVRDNVYSLCRFDLTTGKSATLCEIEDMSNPHVQFEPGAGHHLMVQINRGGRRDPVRGMRQTSGIMGSTLCVVETETGKIHPLPVGRPHTPRISGHECWIGHTGQMLFSAAQYKVTAGSFVTLGEPPTEERHLPAAAVYSVALGDKQPRVVASDILYNHLAASDDGRFFIAEDHPTARIYVGSIATGKTLPLCDSHTRQGACQYSHAHAYMTPDNKHVIYNSIATGCAQVYTARVPDGFLDRLLVA